MYIIGSRKKDNPEVLTFGTPPMIHNWQTNAIVEAERLARAHPGQEFIVWKAMDGYELKSNPVPPLTTVKY